MLPSRSEKLRLGSVADLLCDLKEVIHSLWALVLSSGE